MPVEPSVAAAAPQEPVEMSAQTMHRRAIDEQPREGKGSLLLIVGLCMVTAAIVAVVLRGMQNKGIYAKDVNALLGERDKFLNKPVRAEGILVHGTLEKRTDPCEYKFTIRTDAQTLPVRYAQCVVPDTFRDVEGMDVQVTVEGKLLADNSFEATNVLAKCPSKYDMKQKQARGEAMPHALSQ
jgi:cytochrome c-type biogenesis protein CcmE